MTAKEILTQLQLLGSEAIRNVYKNHGAPVTHCGVKVEDPFAYRGAAYSNNGPE